VVFKYEKSVRISDQIPPTFSNLSSNFKEVVNYYGTGLCYVFDKVPPKTLIYFLIKTYEPYENKKEELIFLVEVENQIISTENELTPLEVHAFCMSYAIAYAEKIGGVGPG
tara:strand:+ start:8637 stop:8969 length:333 start_codon:yes stop_codon:yes gene_type:complete